MVSAATSAAASRRCLPICSLSRPKSLATRIPSRGGLGFPLSSHQSCQEQLSKIILPSEDVVELARVTDAFGIKGEVKVLCLTDEPGKRFSKRGSTFFLQPPAPGGLLGKMESQYENKGYIVCLESAKRISFTKDCEYWALKFATLSSREDAESFRNYTVLMKASAREAPTSPDEFFVSDLIGCDVYLVTGDIKVGNVVEVLEGTGTYDTLRVVLCQTEADKLESQVRVSSIPFVKEICPTVELATKKILVTPPEGLLDIYKTTKVAPSRTF